MVSSEVYDKTAEMESRSERILLPGISDHLLRFEVRLKRSRKVKTYLDLERVNELVNSYYHLEECFHKAMEQVIFIHDIPYPTPFSSSQMTEYMRHMKGTGGRNWKGSMLKKLGYQRLLEICPPSTVTHVLQSIEGNSSDVHRLTKELEEARIDTALQKAKESGKSIAEQYDELKDKVLSPFSPTQPIANGPLLRRASGEAA